MTPVFREKSLSKITHDQILTILFIEGHPETLFKRAAKGSKAAFFQMVMQDMEILISHTNSEMDLISKHSFADVLDAFINGYIKFLEQEIETYRQTGTMPDVGDFAFWFRKLPNAELEAMYNNEYDDVQDSFSYETPEALAYLNNLNEVLTNIEKQAVEKAKAIAGNYIQNRDSHHPFTHDLDLDLELNYFLPESDYEAHRYNDSFSIHQIATKDFTGFLCDGEDWRESCWPALNKPYCYLLHDYLGHSRLSKKDLLSVERIHIELTVQYQAGLDIDKFGNAEMMKPYHANHYILTE